MIGAFLSSGGVTETPRLPEVEMNLVLVIWVTHHKLRACFSTTAADYHKTQVRVILAGPLIPFYSFLCLSYVQFTKEEKKDAHVVVCWRY